MAKPKRDRKCGDTWDDDEGDPTYKEWVCRVEGITFAMDMLPNFCPGCGAEG